ncbi:hypothetical protein JCM8547_001932 [Rhodosporidiobolus lusitaniae]
MLLRLASRSASTATSRRSSSSPAKAVHIRAWMPGDPILFGGAQAAGAGQGGEGTVGRNEREGEERVNSLAKGRDWVPGDAILFGGIAEEEQRSQAGELESRQSTPLRPSTTGATHALASSTSALSVSSGASSWPLSHRFEPPSPSVSPSEGSLARFSLSRSYARGASPSRAPEPTPGGRRVLSQEEMDELVAGIEFGDAEELFSDLDDPTVEASGGKTPAGKLDSQPTDLEALLERIDFSQDVEPSDVEPDSSLISLFSNGEAFFTAPPASPSPPRRRPSPPRAPATPSTSSSAPRIILRNSPSASARPIPTSPVQPDIFSPPRPSASSASETAHLPPASSRHHSHFRSSASSRKASSSTGPLLPSSLPSSLTPSATARTFSSSTSAFIDLTDSPSPPRPSRPPPASSAAQDAFERELDFAAEHADYSLSESDIDDLPHPNEVLARKSRTAATGAAAKGKKPERGAGTAVDGGEEAKSGWFKRPTTLKPLQAEAATNAALPPLSSLIDPSSSSSPVPPPPPIGRGRNGKLTAKQKEDYKQAELKALWPRSFSCKSWEREKRKKEGKGEVRVVVTVDERVVERELARMKGPLGFDLEWTPFSYGGAPGKTALVQVCDENTVLLVQIARMRRFPPALKALIEDPRRIKLGVQIAGDANKLVHDFSFAPAGMLDLNTAARSLAPHLLRTHNIVGLVSLQRLTGYALNRYLPKEQGVRCGKWHLKLSQEQIEYAANDVYASVQILLAVLAAAKSPVPPDYLLHLAGSRIGFDGSVYTGSSSADDPSTSSSSSALTLPSRPFLPPGPAPPGSGPQDVLTPRKLEAFTLFSRGLTLAQITAKMSATGTAIKPTSVVWNLLDGLVVLRERKVEVEWDVGRLVEMVEGVELPARLREQHGGLLEELKATAQGVEGK